MTITSSTITGNTTGIEAYESYMGLQNTTLSNTTNCVVHGFFDLSSDGHNLSSDTTCPDLTAEADQVNVDPLLGPLTDNGGPKETHVPLPGSPVIDAGNCPDQTLDQRGLPRPIDDPTRPDAADGCDIGAVGKQ